ncbi:MAG: hypothetical protein FWD63_03070 [Propionibacteriaceae bacterium]|nr:hypothetical protein [Propionibacteriaceae bacterium]
MMHPPAALDDERRELGIQEGRCVDAMLSGWDGLHLDDDLRSMLPLFYEANTTAFRDGVDTHFCWRVRNQERIIALIVRYGEKDRLILHEESGDDLSSLNFEVLRLDDGQRLLWDTHQINWNIWFNLRKFHSETEPDDRFDTFMLHEMLSAEQLAAYRHIERLVGVPYGEHLNRVAQLRMLSAFTGYDLPPSLGYLQGIFAQLWWSLDDRCFGELSEIPSRYWLLSLRRWACPGDRLSVRPNVEDPRFAVVADGLKPDAQRVLDTTVTDQQDWQMTEHRPETRRLGQAFEIEMLFTALAVRLHDSHDDTSLWVLMRRLRNVFVYDDNVVLVISDIYGHRTVAYRLALQEEWRFVAELEGFVKAMYDGSEDQEFHSFGQYDTPVSKDWIVG